ncbi:MAG: hypothetical protein ACO1OQ_04980 [Rufibacter sp.]
MLLNYHTLQCLSHIYQDQVSTRLRNNDMLSQFARHELTLRENPVFVRSYVAGAFSF